MTLQPHRFATDDVTSAEEFLRGRWKHLGSLELGPDFTLEVTGVQAEGFSMERFSHTSSLRVTAERSGPVKLVEMLSGTASLQSDGQATAIRPGDVVAIDAATTPLSISRSATFGLITMSRELLAAAARVPTERLRFPRRPPLSPERAERWRSAVRRTNRDLSAHLRGGKRDPEESGWLLAQAALASFGHELAPLSASHGMTADPDGPIARAVAYIDTHAAAPLTVGDIATVAGVSVRALQQGFARHHQMSPTAYLRQVRLAGARRELSEATPHGMATVAEVASRWGFSQPGRFAAHYRDAFGVLPSETLRTRPGVEQGLSRG